MSMMTDVAIVDFQFLRCTELYGPTFALLVLLARVVYSIVACFKNSLRPCLAEIKAERHLYLDHF
jgi:hypothetical protein